MSDQAAIAANPTPWSDIVPHSPVGKKENAARPMRCTGGEGSSMQPSISGSALATLSVRCADGSIGTRESEPDLCAACLVLCSRCSSHPWPGAGKLPGPCAAMAGRGPPGRQVIAAVLCTALQKQCANRACVSWEHLSWPFAISALRGTCGQVLEPSQPHALHRRGGVLHAGQHQR